MKNSPPKDFLSLTLKNMFNIQAPYARSQLVREYEYLPSQAGLC